MKIVIGCDEAGCGLKHIIIDLLQKEGIEVTDEGCRDDEVVLYPNIAERVANIVADGEADRGILICGTGIGMAMAANKVKGIRAAVCHDPFSTERSRKSNDAQIMCMGARVIGPELAKMLVKLWLTCEFCRRRLCSQGGSHQADGRKIFQIIFFRRLYLCRCLPTIPSISWRIC